MMNGCWSISYSRRHAQREGRSVEGVRHDGEHQASDGQSIRRRVATRDVAGHGREEREHQARDGEDESNDHGTHLSNLQ